MSSINPGGSPVNSSFPSAAKDSSELFITEGMSLIWLTVPSPLSWDPGKKSWVPAAGLTMGMMADARGISSERMALLIGAGIVKA